jgi:hypothetical protein
MTAQLGGCARLPGSGDAGSCGHSHCAHRVRLELGDYGDSGPACGEGLPSDREPAAAVHSPERPGPGYRVALGGLGRSDRCRLRTGHPTSAAGSLADRGGVPPVSRGPLWRLGRGRRTGRALLDLLVAVEAADGRQRAQRVDTVKVDITSLGDKRPRRACCLTDAGGLQSAAAGGRALA